MTDLKELIRKRGIIKGRLTSFTTYLHLLKPNLTSVQCAELQLRMTKMHEIFSQFDDIQTLIQCTVDESELTAQATERAEFETSFYSVLAKSQDLFDANNPKAAESDEDTLSHRSEHSQTRARPVAERMRVGTGTSRGVRLPTINLPKFSGRYEEWLEFRDTFNSLIHDNCTITNIQKFHYLRASLEGSAVQIIRSLEFSSENYHVAWELLCDRYDNTRLLIQNHVQALFSLEQIKRESAQAIRNLIDTVSKNLRALETLGEPTSSWDTLIIYIMNSKLDARTLREWEERKPAITSITLAEFTKFLKDRADLLETLNMNLKTEKQRYTNTSEHVKGLATFTNSQYHSKCPICDQGHRIFACDIFRSQSVGERAESVRRHRLCNNCLRPGHQARVCRLGPCTVCSQHHNTLLHTDSSKVDAPVDRATATTLSVNTTEPVLLSTAVLYIVDKDSKRHEARAVLDSGSQASFMTETLLNKLKLKSKGIHTSVIGINNSVSKITKRCSASIKSRVSPYEVEVSFLVLPNIASLCNNSANIQPLNLPKEIQLADPEYFSPSSIDLLLGADIFWDLLDQGQIRLGEHSPVLQQTKLGYIISGPTSGLNQTIQNNSNKTITCNFIQNEETQIQDQLSKFWSLEEVSPVDSNMLLSEEERLCEENFNRNVTRVQNGRFSVSIPLKMPESGLGESYERAKQCFLSLERKLQRQPRLKQMYTDFIAEYKQLGHMSSDSVKHISESNQGINHSYYLPHHGVLRESSTTTKLRVVFNASAPTTTGISCNDLQMVGPTIQSDLFTILIRFRHFVYVMTGDIEKMYRQVLIHENQRHLQRIVWRDDPNRELQTYELNTVTYGMAAAPFLAIRCLKQLALECDDSVMAQIISEDFYVDDLVTGSQSVEELSEIHDKICRILLSGCFPLRKIKSNIQNLSSSESDNSKKLNLGEPSSSHTLGLGWLAAEDELHFDTKPTIAENPTKRSILSTIGQIFDPLGLLSIVIIQAKILLQKLWLHKLSWDDPLPIQITQAWCKFTSELHLINDIRIPRCVTCKDPVKIELHTFCDSSQDAFGACVYIRSISRDGKIHVHLLCAKSRVAPLKPVTIPRLELCGALVAARLIAKVVKAFRIPIDRSIMWSDSTIVLAWLKMAPNKLKLFVKTRVAEIQEITKSYPWRHVPTAHNPADLLSRGVNMANIQDSTLWWNGPPFLQDDESIWPKTHFNHISEIPEVVSQLVVDTKTKESIIDIDRFSKLLKLKRSLAYAMRFMNNSKKGCIKQTGSLTVEELNNAFTMLLKWSQKESFDEYKTLQNKQTLSSKSRLLPLSPFLDDTGLIRVGGRLENSKFDYTKKHPILISCQHPIAKLIFTEEHVRLFHAAPQLLLASIRERFWPLGGRNMARNISRKCQRCFRMAANTVNPIMGQLPEQRLDPGYPFQTTGVDYAGPLLAADRKGRGCRTTKVYVAVFVCFATKALHLELVSDLTKESYVAALRRFIARRSKPYIIFSDNGTQFIGAKNEIGKFLKQNSSVLSEITANENINFKFIPAYAPHFGGLWEAGVRSFKYHLVRVLREAHLTFEELYTSLVQIEAILNSRPLSPISSDPNDLTPLTPGHFLVGRPLAALPTPRLDDANPNRLQRWERVESLRQHFWIRWQKEYVSELQQKTKWRSASGRLDKGTLVLIKEDYLPPMKWSLGRIIEVFPGVDGVVRVADIQTSKGIQRRAFNRICPLPIEESPAN